jgi:type I restriction enzyme R subunit
MRVIEREVEKDPAFYRKFSKMLEDILAALHQKRMEAIEALKRVQDIALKVATHTDDDTPATLSGNDMARRFYGCVRETMATYVVGKPDPTAAVALAVVDRIRKHRIRDWRDNPDALNRMRGEIDDVLFEVAAQYGLQIPLDVHDRLIDDCLNVAIANED